VLCHIIQLVANLFEDPVLLKITAKEFRRHLSCAVAKSACGIVYAVGGRVWEIGWLEFIVESGLPVTTA
jgi:hypothetical protein